MCAKSQFRRVPFRSLKVLNPNGKMFCVITGYMDESYNNRTMCVGGWLLHETRWPSLEHQWQARIEYENRISKKKGLPKQLSRYKAADCASLVSEFEGWTVPRQIQFSKKLIEIIARHRPVAFVFGATRKELIETFPDVNDDNWKHCSYYFCMYACLAEICQFMHEQLPRGRVAIIHDHGPFNHTAQLAFMSLKKSFQYSEYIVTVAPMEWRERVALQPADLIAFEGYKLVEADKDGREMRKSLQRMMGKKIGISAGYTKPEFLEFFKERRTVLMSPDFDHH